MMKSWIGSGKDDYEERNRVSSFRGYLQKLRRSPNLLAPQWGKRWFSIEAHFLKWYRHETDLCSAGMVNLKYVKNIHKSDNLGPFTFTIICDDRTLVLKCLNQTEMNSWIRALHKQADIARGGSGMTVVSDFNKIPVDASSVKSPKKQGKSKNSLSLEEELDLTLKKLDELEHKVQHEDFEVEEPMLSSRGSDRPSRGTDDRSDSRESRQEASTGDKYDRKTAQGSDRRLDGRRREERKVSDRRAESKLDRDDPLEDSMGSFIEVPIRYANQGPKPKGSADSRGLISINSIEDISLNTPNNKAVRSRRQQQEEQQQQEQQSKNRRRNPSDVMINLEDSPPVPVRDVSKGRHQHLVMESVDEFDVLEDFPEEDSTRRVVITKQSSSSRSQQREQEQERERHQQRLETEGRGDSRSRNQSNSRSNSGNQLHHHNNNHMEESSMRSPRHNQNKENSSRRRLQLKDDSDLDEDDAYPSHHQVSHAVQRQSSGRAKGTSGTTTTSSSSSSSTSTKPHMFSVAKSAPGSNNSSGTSINGNMRSSNSNSRAFTGLKSAWADDY